jgi:hypothetical protein
VDTYKGPIASVGVCITGIDFTLWKEELRGHRDFFAMFGDRLPDKTWEESNALAHLLNRCSSDS